MERLLAFVSLLIGCATSQPIVPIHHQAGQTPDAQKIVILLSGDNPLFSRPVDAFKAQIRAEVSTYDIPEDPDPLIEHLCQKPPALIFAVGSRAALLARRELGQIPMLFTMVVNHTQYPELTGVPDVMGVALEPAPATEFLKFKLVLPEMKKVLTFYESTTSEAQVKAAREQLDSLGITLVAVAVDTQEALERAYLQQEADAVWLSNDRVMANRVAFEFLRTQTVADRRPLLTSLTDLYARAGALSSVSVDLLTVGSQAASIAGIYLQTGRAPGVQPPVGTTLAVNRATANAIGVEVPDDALQFVDRLFVEVEEQ